MGGKPFHNSNLLAGAGAATAGNAPDVLLVKEHDENGNVLTTETTLRVVKPVDGSPSFIELEDSAGEIQDA